MRPSFRFINCPIYLGPLSYYPPHKEGLETHFNFYWPVLEGLCIHSFIHSFIHDLPFNLHRPGCWANRGEETSLSPCQCPCCPYLPLSPAAPRPHAQQPCTLYCQHNGSARPAHTQPPPRSACSRTHSTHFGRKKKASSSRTEPEWSLFVLLEYSVT